MLSLEEEAITKKRQGKKNVNAATHDPTTQNYSNKSPTAESYNSDEKDSGEFKMTIADTRETPTAHRETTPGASSPRLIDATVQTAAQPNANNNAATSVEQVENTSITAKQHQRQPS